MFPHIIKVCLAAQSCNSVVFKSAGDMWFSSDPELFQCPSDPATHDVTFMEIYRKVMFVCLLQAIGATIGEIPPYYISRSARMIAIEAAKSGLSDDSGSNSRCTSGRSSPQPGTWSGGKSALKSSSNNLQELGSRRGWSNADDDGENQRDYIYTPDYDEQGFDNLEGVALLSAAEENSDIELGPGLNSPARELPPGVSLSAVSSELPEELAVSGDDPNSCMNAAKAWMIQFLKTRGFYGVIMLASVPNLAFDLCGICCGHFLMPFWTFFGATFIGKVVIRNSYQSLMYVALCSEEYLDLIIYYLCLLIPDSLGMDGMLKRAILDARRSFHKSQAQGATAAPSADGAVSAAASEGGNRTMEEQPIAMSAKNLQRDTAGNDFVEFPEGSALAPDGVVDRSAGDEPDTMLLTSPGNVSSVGEVLSIGANHTLSDRAEGGPQHAIGEFIPDSVPVHQSELTLTPNQGASGGDSNSGSGGFGAPTDAEIEAAMRVKVAPQHLAVGDTASGLGPRTPNSPVYSFPKAGLPPSISISDNISTSISTAATDSEEDSGFSFMFYWNLMMFSVLLFFILSSLSSLAQYYQWILDSEHCAAIKNVIIAKRNGERNTQSSSRTSGGGRSEYQFMSKLQRPSYRSTSTGGVGIQRGTLINIRGNGGNSSGMRASARNQYSSGVSSSNSNNNTSVPGSAGMSSSASVVVDSTAVGPLTLPTSLGSLLPNQKPSID